MEPNQTQNTPVQPMPQLNPTSSSMTAKIIIAVVAIVVLGGGAAAAYKYVYIPKHEATLARLAKEAEDNKVLGLEKRVAEATGFVDFTPEEYELLLSKPVNNPDIKAPTNTIAPGGITIGFDGETFKMAIPYLPNIEGSEKVFAHFDSILTTDGKEVFNKESGFEEDDDMFTDLELEKKTSDGKAYWLGERDPHLTESIDANQVGKVTGKIIINLPTNTQTVKLTKEDIGKEKILADGKITLKDLSKDSATFEFSGDTDKIYSYTGFDDKGKKLDRDGYSIMNGEYTIGYDNPAYIEVTAADVEKKTYPFSFGSSDRSDPITNVATSTSENPASDKVVEKPAESLPTTKTSDSEPTAEEKTAAIDAYFEFGRVLDTKTPKTILDYFLKAYPEDAAQAQKEYDKDPNPKDFGKSIDFLKDILGYGDTTKELLNSTKAIWTKNDNKIKVTIWFLKDKDTPSGSQTMYFVQHGGIWYLDFKN